MDSLDSFFFVLVCCYEGTKSFNELVSDPDILVTKDSI